MFKKTLRSGDINPCYRFDSIVYGYNRLILSAFIIGFLVIGSAHSAASDEYKKKYSRYVLSQDTDVSHITIKYKVGTGMRLRNGALKSNINNKLPKNLKAIQVDSDAISTASILSINNLSIKRSFSSMSEDQLDDLKKNGEIKSKKQLGDMNLFYTVPLPEFSTYASVEKILDQLNQLDSVEFAYAKPMPLTHINLMTEKQNSDSKNVVKISSQKIDQSKSFTIDAYDDVPAQRPFSDDYEGDAVSWPGGNTTHDHNFHDAIDKDWTMVWISQDGYTKFSTQNVGLRSDTRIYVYKYTSVRLNPAGTNRFFVDQKVLLGTDSTASGNSSVIVEVEAGFLYGVKVESKNANIGIPYFGPGTEYKLKIEGFNHIPDAYDDVPAQRPFSDDYEGDAVNWPGGNTTHDHNFFDAGDEDWTMAWIGQDGNSRFSTELIGDNSDTKIYVYKYTSVRPNPAGVNRFFVDAKILVGSDEGQGDNSVTVDTEAGFLYGVKVVSRMNNHGLGTEYKLKIERLTRPDHEPLQGYLNAAPEGVNAHYAWTQSGGKGDGVKIIDIEQAWNNEHEDLPDMFYDSGNHYDGSLLFPIQTYKDHGTAVLGVLGAKDNGFGVTGIANHAALGIEAAWEQPYSNDVKMAILNAATQLNPGDIMLLELQDHSSLSNSALVNRCLSCPQTSDSSNGQTSPSSSCGLVPIEFYDEVFVAIETVTANGIVVVEAAGNGASDLDDPIYGGIFDKHIRDSGAIMVGASTEDAVQRTAMCFSNHGNRVDVHGWGENVVTTGYGPDRDDLTSDDGVENIWYTRSFAGTSSASPIVAGAAASMQGVRKARGLAPLDSIEMRGLLSYTGTTLNDTYSPPLTAPSDREIGLLPDLSRAIASLNNTPTLSLVETVCGNNYCIRLLGQNFNVDASVLVGTTSSLQSTFDTYSGHDIYSRSPVGSQDRIQFPIQNLTQQNLLNTTGLCFRVRSNNKLTDAQCITRPVTAPQSAFMGSMVESYNSKQDLEHTSFVVGANGNKMKIWGNSWKKIDYSYNVTPDTMLKFEFRSNKQQAEVNGIGFILKGSHTVSVANFWQVFGTQTWGQDQTHHNYSGNDWVTYQIPIGQAFTGAVKEMVFAAAEDKHVGQNVVYKNPVLFENIKK